MVIVAPVLFTGRMLYLRATSAGISLMTRGVDLEVREVDRRHAELLRQTLGDVFLGHESELDERLAELAAGLLLELAALP